MPIEKDLSVSPYFENSEANNDYYRVLFRPSVAVQARELNEIQTLSQNQLERFADNIFKRGTIIDGVNFSFYNNYPYAKLVDNEIDGTISVPSLYKGLFAKNANNLTAYIVDAVDGFETSSPDLKTIYLQYTNAGDSQEEASFAAGDTLTIYDSANKLFSVTVNTGGLGFSNSDHIVVTPALVVNVTSGSLSNGDYLIQPSTGANLQIIAIDDDTLAFANQLIISVKPRNVDLANASANSLFWTFDIGEDVVNDSSTAGATVLNIIGANAEGHVVTSGVGTVLDVAITNRGGGYVVAPHIGVRSITNLSGLNALDMIAKNYLAKIVVSSDANSVGNGYAFGVGEGTIYQKGYMLRVAPQTVLVDKYSPSPNNVTVGFKSREEIVDYNIDTGLLDNALGTENESAPGANRLKIIPELTVLPIEEAGANDDFFTLVEWSDGNPYKQNRVTSYSRLGDEMARRTAEESGNYVLDPFQVQTTSTANTQKEGTHYTVVVDPGTAYISGYRVATSRNFLMDVPKGLDTKTANNTVSLNYGNYVRVKELAGLFQFSTGDTVKLYNTAKGYLSSLALVEAGSITAPGTQLGTARIRSLVHENGPKGEGNTSYRAYLFDIRMNPGQNFRDVKALFYDGTYKGVADCILETDPSTATAIAVLKGVKNDKLLFSAGVESLKNSNNTNYIYRTIDQTTTFANSGIFTKSIAATPNEFYPYTGELSDSQMQELTITPIGNNLLQYTDMTGTVEANDQIANLVGTSTTFLTEFAAGDYIYVYDEEDATNNDIKRILFITNGTHMTVDSNCSFVDANAHIKRVFPKHVPIPFGTRDGLSANVDANGNVLRCYTKHSNGSMLTLTGSVTINTAAAVNIRREDVTSTAKTVNRNKFVKLRLANAVATTTGPWCLGVPDACRLRSVYVGNSTVNSSAFPNIVNDFYIDHNQNANYLDLSYLYRHPRSRLTLDSADYLLVEFDHFTRSDDGYFDAVSYRNTANAAEIATLDSLPLANLSSAASSWEIPEVYTSRGQYFDLINQFDFRPAVANTAAPGVEGSAPVNPAATLSFGNTADPANDKKFPLPDTSFATQVEYYLGRMDGVFIGGEKGNIFTLKGTPDVDPRKRYEPSTPNKAIKLQVLSVPPYPSISNFLTPQVAAITNTRVFNEKKLNQRLTTRRVTTMLSDYDFNLAQPVGYTMADIGNLDRRLKDVEYYVGLSVLETSITNKIIPSSLDGTLNRFKFGFFADDFSTSIYSALSDPQYAAAIEPLGFKAYGGYKNPIETESGWVQANTDPASSLLSPTKVPQKATNLCTPPRYVWKVPHIINSQPWIDDLLIDQNNATDAAHVCIIGSNVITINATSNTVVVNNFIINFSEGGSAPSGGGGLLGGLLGSLGGSIFGTLLNGSYGRIDNKSFDLTSRGGTIGFYFYNYRSGTSFDIYQGNTLIASTNASSNAVTNFTAADKVFLSSNTQIRNWYYFLQDGSWNINQTFVRGTGANVNFVTWGGKLSWTHNANNGTSYRVVVNQLASAPYKYLIEYPVAYTTNTAATTIDPCANNPTIPVVYQGRFTTDSWTLSGGSSAPQGWYRVQVLKGGIPVTVRWGTGNPTTEIRNLAPGEYLTGQVGGEGGGRTVTGGSLGGYSPFR